MKKIILCCAAGMSTSLLVEKMKEDLKSRGLSYEIEAVAVESISDVVSDASVILLGPQIRYKQNSIKEICTAKNIDINVEVINMLDYGSMNGKKVIDQALSLIKE